MVSNLVLINLYHKDGEEEHYSGWEKVYPEIETREDSVLCE